MKEEEFQEKVAEAMKEEEFQEKVAEAMKEEEFQEKVAETLEAVEAWIGENLGKHKREQQIMEMRRRIV